jgi:hypothetical protein
MISAQTWLQATPSTLAVAQWACLTGVLHKLPLVCEHGADIGQTAPGIVRFTNPGTVACLRQAQDRRRSTSMSPLPSIQLDAAPRAETPDGNRSSLRKLLGGA